MYRRSLRPIIVFVAGISLIWGVVLGVRFIRARSDSFSTSRMRTFDLGKSQPAHPHRNG